MRFRRRTARIAAVLIGVLALLASGIVPAAAKSHAPLLGNVGCGNEVPSAPKNQQWVCFYRAGRVRKGASVK